MSCGINKETTYNSCTPYRSCLRSTPFRRHNLGPLFKEYVNVPYSAKKEERKVRFEDNVTVKWKPPVKRVEEEHCIIDRDDPGRAHRVIVVALEDQPLTITWINPTTNLEEEKQVEPEDIDRWELEICELRKQENWPMGLFPKADAVGMSEEHPHFEEFKEAINEIRYIRQRIKTSRERWQVDDYKFELICKTHELREMAEEPMSLKSTQGVLPHKKIREALV